MPAGGRTAGQFDAAVWEKRMARRVRRVPAADHTTLPMSPAAHIPHLVRACRLLRDRLNRLEDPKGPLSVAQRRRLSHQTSRLSRVVEALMFVHKEHAGERHAGERHAA